ncbi:MAG: grasp-with-spasm system ATP-grasp peptide maturase [Bacteroidia bacterium]
MILIISQDYDRSTFEICKWLKSFNKSYLILLDTDVISLVKLNARSIILKNVSRNYIFDITEIKKIFFRRGGINFFNINFTNIKDNHFKIFLSQENFTILDSIYKLIPKELWIGSPLKADLNKIVVLYSALNFSLKVPDFIVTSDKKELINFIKKHNEIISKTILPGVSFQRKDYVHTSNTEIFNKQDLKNLNNNFHPTFFQKYIQKKYEIRSFYFQNNFYSIAIFSQFNRNTKVDYRNYTNKTPNRSIVFKLPSKIENKLKMLIFELKLDYCSIDLIYSIENEFYFLEINPIGQFGNVSYSGNYYIEKLIANELKDN